jgi:hypothetical protein
MRYGVLAIGVVTMATHYIKVATDKLFAANHQTIHKTTQSFSIDTRNLKAACGFFLNDPLGNRGLTLLLCPLKVSRHQKRLQMSYGWDNPLRAARPWIVPAESVGLEP